MCTLTDLRHFIDAISRYYANLAQGQNHPKMCQLFLQRPSTVLPDWTIFKSSWSHFFTNVVQIYCNFFGYLKIIPFFRKNVLTIFTGATFRKFWATFHFSIWSHWCKMIRLKSFVLLVPALAWPTARRCFPPSSRGPTSTRSGWKLPLHLYHKYLSSIVFFVLMDTDKRLQWHEAL